jgi:tRNA A-37 threonylcarbamoyl transferase component Bud32
MVVKDKCKKFTSSFVALVEHREKQNSLVNSMSASGSTTIQVTRQGLSAGFTHLNDSNATTIINPPALRLILRGDSGQAEPALAHSAPTTPGPQYIDQKELHPVKNSLSPAVDDRRLLKRSQSSPGLQTRISQKFFGAQTVIHRADLRSRPSIYSLPSQPLQTSWNTEQLSSTPSTYNSDSGSTPPKVLTAHSSTPPTSDFSPSPRSVTHHGGVSGIHTSGYWHSHDYSNQCGLPVIPEGSVVPNITIVTVEATATAKVFFETYFNSLLHDSDSRQRRRFELEQRLRECQSTVTLEYRARKAWAKHETQNLRLYRSMMAAGLSTQTKSSVAVGSYEVVKILGKGSFGVVRLVREKPPQATIGRTCSNAGVNRLPTRSIIKHAAQDAIAPLTHRRVDLTKVKKEVYAMKVIRKSDMLRNSQEGHLRAERDFLVCAEGSQWIIPLVAAFQDAKFLYLVMDFCIGGDFLGLLIRKNILSEEITKWYIAEMILCVEEAHRMKWIHRDVKPDNFLIGADGHLKISDFGLAFDGQWDHDQKYYHKQRHDLVDKLGIMITGDSQDQQEEEVSDNVSRIADVWPGSRWRAGAEATNKDEGGEPLLDRRNRKEQRRLARSVVGTSQYMAPEVIRGDLYDGRCD